MKKQILLVVSILLFGCSIVSAQSTAEKPRIINGGVINGKSISLPIPQYPAAAMAVRASGTVNVQVTIDEEGNVISATAVSGHPLLRQASEQAARAAKFSPTKLSGQAVNVTGIIVYNFVPSKVVPSNEEKLQIMGLGAFLSIYNSIEGSETIKREKLAETPQFANELMPLSLMTKETSKEKRAEIVSKVIASVGNKLSGADAWQFEFGKSFGKMMLESIPKLKKSDENTDISFNETKVKTNLLEMKSLIFTAPTDFPPDVLDKLKELIKFADIQNLNSVENKNRFMQLIIETLNIISPDSLK